MDWIALTISSLLTLGILARTLSMPRSLISVGLTPLVFSISFKYSAPVPLGRAKASTASSRVERKGLALATLASCPKTLIVV